MRNEKGQFVKGHNLGTHRSDETKLKIGKTSKRLGLHPPIYFGKDSSNWKGGRIYDGQGYIKIYMPEHPFNNDSYVLEHRLVMEQFLGRYLLQGEIIHHINGITDDNRKENLLLFENKSKHSEFHNRLNRLALAI